MLVLQDDILRKTECESINLAIRRLASTYVPGEIRTRCPIDLMAIAVHLGVKAVSKRQLPCEAALVPVNPEKYRILISADSPPARQRFSLAHELAHIILHKLLPETRSFETRSVFSPPGSRQEERICDQLAAEILMPSETFEIDSVGASFSPSGILSLAGKYRVSIAAAAYRLRDFRHETDFAILQLQPREHAYDVRRTLVNFAHSQLRHPPMSVQLSRNPARNSSIHKHGLKSWVWVQEGCRKRRLFANIQNTCRTREAESCIAVLTRTET